MSLIMFEDFDYLFFFASDKFWGSEKIVFPKIFEFEKTLGPKKFGLKNFGCEKFLGENTFYFGSEKILGRTKI